MKNKQYALQLLKEKINGERIISYVSISELSGYSEKQIRRWSRAEYRKRVYSTRQIAGHKQNPLKRQQKIQNQKELDEYLRLQNSKQ